MTNHTHVKVPCGGWILKRESDAHIKKCEMCEAFLDYKQEKFNYRANVITVVLLTIAAYAIVMIWRNF